MYKELLFLRIYEIISLTFSVYKNFRQLKQNELLLACFFIYSSVFRHLINIFAGLCYSVTFLKLKLTLDTMSYVNFNLGYPPL